MPDELTSIEIEGRIVQHICRGTGTPTVIIDQGQGLSIERGFSNPTPAGWANVFGAIQKAARVFMHDRAGLGWSDVSPSPRVRVPCARQAFPLKFRIRCEQFGTNSRSTCSVFPRIAVM
jgi:hypothetical protein